MNTPVPGLASAPTRFGLSARLGIIVAVLAGETVLASYFIQLSPFDTLTGGAAALHDVQHWLFRFLIAYAISLAMLTYLRANAYAAAAAEVDRAPVRFSWAVAHLAAARALRLSLCADLCRFTVVAAFAVLAVAWHTCALAAVLALFAALAPFAVWRNAIRQTRPPLLRDPAGSCRRRGHQGEPNALGSGRRGHLPPRQGVVAPDLPALHSDPASLVLGTERFAVQIAERCSASKASAFSSHSARDGFGCFAAIIISRVRSSSYRSACW